MNTSSVSHAASVLAKAPRRAKLDTATGDMFADHLPPASPAVGVQEPTATKRTPRRRGHQPNGAELRDAGIANAAKSAGDAWQTAALAIVRVFAGSHVEFTCDEARLWSESVGFEVPPEARAWGHVMLAAKRAGFIAATDVFATSNDPACHRSPARVWHSLIYKPPGSTL